MDSDRLGTLMNADLSNITPPRTLSPVQKFNIFQFIFRRLAGYRNTLVLYAVNESSLSQGEDEEAVGMQEAVEEEVNVWAQELLKKAWVVCFDGETETTCPRLDPLADTSTAGLCTNPPSSDLSKFINAILFLDITAHKGYSALTRTFLSTFCLLDESTISVTLHNPTSVVEAARKKANIATALGEHAQRGMAVRFAGASLGAIAGGVLIGVTGGLAAPLVGAGVSGVLGFLGIGGSVLGLLASGLAGSSVVCAALFGAYGAREMKHMVERHMREVKDLEVLNVRFSAGKEKLGVMLCVSGWINEPEDVTAPWRVLDETNDDIFALQWETEALKKLSEGVKLLVQSEVLGYVKGQILRKTVLAGLMASLAPLSLLRIGHIIDNPWMNARALAIKTGAVVGDLLAKRVFGSRPVSLAGYSLGALVIFEALRHLATLPAVQTTHIIHDVFLFGSPVSTHPANWTAVRRVVAGRLVNVYSRRDWVLAIACRVSEATTEIAGMQSVDGVKGVENICCDEVEGHTAWKTVIAKTVGPRAQAEDNRC